MRKKNVKLSSREEKQKAFTFVEMFVVFFIICIMSSTIGFSYVKRSQALRLEQSANLLAQNIRKAIEMTMSSQETSTYIVPAGGYGVKLEKNQTQFIIYPDCDENHLPDAPSCGTQETIQLERDVIISRVYTGGNDLRLTFQPPDPKIFFDNNQARRDETAQIIIKLVPTGQEKTITVYPSGLID